MSPQVLNNTSLMEAAPSIFAKAPHSSRSQRYAHVPTVDVIELMRKSGFVPTSASETHVRKHREDHLGFQRHLIRLRSKNDLEKVDRKVGDVVPEIVLINAHDGSSSFQLEGGLFRMACSNGLIIKSADYGSIRVHHSGRELEAVVKEAVEHITSQLPLAVRATKEWDKIILSPAQRTRFANKALAMRYHGNSPITAAQALTPRRNEDEGPSLWRTFNVLEENLAKGGVTGKTVNGRKSTTRSLKSVGFQLYFERNLWEMAAKIAA
jgi:hypothetical protein